MISSQGETVTKARGMLRVGRFEEALQGGLALEVVEMMIDCF